MSNDDITKFLGALSGNRKFAPEVAKARTAEMMRRYEAARAKAINALARAYPFKFRALYDEALRRVNAERGPLPGDPE